MSSQPRATEQPATNPQPKPSPKPDTSTIGGMIANGHRLFADCVYCNRHEELDLHKLAGLLGANHSALRDGLLPRMVCKECGSRDYLQFIVMPVQPMPFFDDLPEDRQNAYQRAKDGW